MLNITESSIQKGPKILEVHLGNGCKLNCPFCYNRRKKFYNSDNELITDDCLKTLINDFAALGGEELYVSGGLEPFSAHMTVCHALLLAHRACLKARVYTNGTEPALQTSLVQEVLHCTAAQIRISVHALSLETYSKITGIGNAKATFELVKKTILSLLGKGEGGPKVGIGFLVITENVHELIEAAEYWRDLRIDFFDVRFDCANEMSAFRKISKEVLHFQKLADKGHFAPMKVNIGHYAYGKFHFASQCYAPFQKLVVDPFGNVWSCCLQAQPNYRPDWAKLGDLNTDTLTDIIRRTGERLPRPHCEQCTPYEAKCNLLREGMTERILSA